MRVLLDEHLPRRLKRLFKPGVEALTVDDLGWKGTKNGALLRAAADQFQAFVTMDRGIPHQQNMREIGCGVILLEAHSNRFVDLAPLMPSVNDALDRLGPGDIVRVRA
jgi:predicted nuclease of predicted toxin-antitoxin system